MKPPLVKFRLGDMFGSQNNEITGFIKSLTNTVPDNSNWETREGRKVPKMIDVNISYQVIHGTPPNLNTSFYGYPKIKETDDTNANNVNENGVSAAVTAVGG